MARAKRTTEAAAAEDESAPAEDKKGAAKGAALAMLQGDALGDVLGDYELETDGMEELEASDVRFAKLVWNFGGIDEVTGEPIPKNRFFNTVSEEVSVEEALAILTFHKSRAWKEFDEGKNKTVYHCTTWDRVTGTMEDGTTRNCAKCPDKVWRQDEETGKRTRNCADVANVVALRLEGGDPVLMAFTRTSDRPWSDYLNKHVIGKRIVGGKRVNMPLFAHPTTISLKMVKSAGGMSYAVPVFERAEEPFARNDIIFFAESAKGFREGYLDEIREAIETPTEDAEHSPARGGAAGGDDFAEGGDDFAEGDDGAPPDGAPPDGAPPDGAPADGAPEKAKRF